MKYVGKFIGAFLFVNFILIPALILGYVFLFSEEKPVVVEEFTYLSSYTITDSAGDEYVVDHEYDFRDFRHVTTTITENGVLRSTEDRDIDRQDLLITGLWNHWPPEDFTPARTEQEGQGSTITLRYYDEAGNLLGWSEQVYNTYDRLGRQQDFDADGKLLRTITLNWGSKAFTDSELEKAAEIAQRQETATTP